MLAELKEVSNSLADSGVSAPEVHKWLKPIGRGAFAIANLDEYGSVREVELRESSDGSGIVKIQKDNQNGFPTFKVKYPLFTVGASNPARDRLKAKGLTNADRAQILRDICVKAEPAQGLEKSKKRLAQFRKFAIEKLKARFEPVLVESPALAKLFSGIASDQFDSEIAIRQMADAAVNAVERGESADLATRMLIGPLKKSGDIESDDLPVFLDAWRAPQDNFTRLSHPKTRILYNKVLLSELTGTADGTCGLSGEQQQLERGNLPSPRLPALADTILFSVFGEIPCLMRYGLIGSDAFPIGKRTAQALNSAALWITNEARKGKTWATVPRNDEAKNDLMIAYINSAPELEANLAEMLASPEQQEAAFEISAARVIKALEMRKLTKKSAVLHAIVLRRISKGQVQVELSREYQVDRIFNAFAEWQAAAANTPSISLFVPTGKGKPPRLIESRVPFPAEFVRATKSLWIRSGGESQATVGCSIAIIYDLYLGEGSTAQTAARVVLSMMLERCTRLLLLTGDQLSRYGRGVLDVPVTARAEAVLAATILGITLYKLDRRKELYMNETAFLLGRMLALSDILHAQYCRVVRDDHLPPQLLGNQHYAMAADRPARAVAVLGDRLRIYRAWADTSRVDKNGTLEAQRAVRTAKWAVLQMSEIAPEVHGKLPERGFDDKGKAEMLLGYLSRGGKERKEGEEDSE